MFRQKISKFIFITSIVAVIPFNSAFATTTGEVNGNSVRLRKEPSTDSKIITLLKKGEKVSIISQKDGWYNIECGNSKGWVSESLLLVEAPLAKVEKEENTTKTEVSGSTAIVAVTGNSVNLREGPTVKTSIVGKVVAGDNLVSYGKTADGLWYKVKFADKEGYIYADYVTTDENKIVGEGTINDNVRLRKEPSTKSEVIDNLSTDSKVTITGSKGEWYKVLVDDEEGYVVARCVDRVTVTSRSGGNSTAQKVVELAKQQLGKKYVYGSAGPNTFDCSGFTKYIYGKVGVTLERVSSSQASQGIAVSKSNLQPGDLLFFSGINASSASARISHVGIYIGNNMFIHAANSKRGVVMDDITENYYTTHLVTARRVIR